MKVNNIVKVFGVFACSIAFSASAQMLDILGGGAVGGAIMKGEIASVDRGMKALKYTQLVQELSQNAQMIRIKYMGKYDTVGMSDVLGGILKKYNTTAGMAERYSHFYLEVSGVDKGICRQLVAADVGAISVVVNGQNKNINACSDLSKIKFIFN